MNFTKFYLLCPVRTREFTFDSVQFKVFDVLGNEIATLVNEELPTGSYKEEFNASDLVSGIYLYELKAGGFVETKKMILLK